MHAEVAETFLAGNNRVILAGDAAHRFPPAGGFGMYFFILCSVCIVTPVIMKNT